MTGVNRSMEKQGSSLSLPVLLGLVVGLLTLLFLELAIGSVRIPIGAIFRILGGQLFGDRLLGESTKTSWVKIVLLFRLPRAVTAALAGAALSVSGLQMQTVFRNPLAGPSILGIGQGASLGVALVVLTLSGAGTSGLFLESIGLVGDMGIVVAASLGSLMVLGLVLYASRRVQSVMTILILGVLFGYATGAIVSLLIHFSVADRVQAYITWTFGDFGGTTWSQIKVFAPVILIVLAITQLSVKRLNTLLLGETYARSMGLRVKRSRTFIICTTAVLSGAVTAFCGPIAFLGVAVPHLCRGLFNTSNHRVLLPSTVILGAAIALLADLVAHVPGTQIVLPVNAVTALIGTPVVAWVILRKRNMRSTFAA